MAGLWELLDSTATVLLSFRSPRRRGPEQPALPAGFVLGTILEGNAVFDPFFLTAKEASTTHYVIGSSGSGKSTYLLKLFDWEVEQCR